MPLTIAWLLRRMPVHLYDKSVYTHAKKRDDVVVHEESGPPGGVSDRRVLRRLAVQGDLEHFDHCHEWQPPASIVKG